MMTVAMIGLMLNVSGALILSRTEGENLNVQGVLRHVIADVLGPVGVIGAAFVILLTGWYYADPIISALIALLVFGSSCASRSTSCSNKPHTA